MADRPVDATQAFARLLRHWRQVRGVSQLALATGAEVSVRHLSFLETGRARPSREMVERLAAALECFHPADGETEAAAARLAAAPADATAREGGARNDRARAPVARARIV